MTNQQPSDFEQDANPNQRHATRGVGQSGLPAWVILPPGFALPAGIDTQGLKGSVTEPPEAAALRNNIDNFPVHQQREIRNMFNETAIATAQRLSEQGVFAFVASCDGSCEEQELVTISLNLFREGSPITKVGK